MPKRVKELSAVEVKRLSHAVSKETGKAYGALHPVGGVPGLCLQVTPSGGKSWLLRIKVGEKRREIGLGSYPALSLSDARRKAQEQRELVEQGIDPVEAKRAARRDLVAQQRAMLTFDQAAERFIAIREKEFRNARQSAQWRSSLDTYASPKIGKLPVRDITRDDVLSVLSEIWETKTETATRVRSRIENILDWSTREGYREGTNPASWKDSLKGALPDPSKIRTRRHFKALPLDQVQEFVAELRTREANAARALEMVMLTASRPNEVVGDKRLGKLGMEWSEIDLDAKLWTVPASKMKSGKEHRVPLCDRAVAILESLPQDHPAVFHAKREIPSDNFLRALVKRMGYDLDPHGLRSTFKDWAREFTTYADEVSELALAHVSTDATRAAYARSELVGLRRDLMRDWQRYCEQGAPQKAKVRRIRA